MICSQENLDYHYFRFTDGAVRSCFSETSFRDVISTEAFRRLKSIHFLGSIDYLLSGPRTGVEERHTRYDHSLGVASLAKRFALAKGLSGNEYETIVIAALLHDIGHAPLSHSLEPTFVSIFDVNHHLVGEKILRGEVRLGVKLAKALERLGINNFEVMSLISGVGCGIGREIFSRAINVDTIEGIIRSASYQQRKEVLLNPVAVIDAYVDLGNPSHEILDEFWRTKDYVYSSIIQSKIGLVADYICKKYMELNSSSFSASYYYGTEAELKKDHANLFCALDLFGRTGAILPSLVRDGEEIVYTKRKFFIDASIPLRDYRDVDRRYRQVKERKVVSIKKTGGEGAHGYSEHNESRRLF
ncbi:HD domain-containing protein [uncultured Xanthomonas sp.]|uniref:HD domain-containing protein n=1 Tax=uncultured Xanthomonas sp. TaxID=152831 RepID=UPI0025D836C9|nr:HD domain-containing protein [uncultured Xanthomonas sp.]